MLPEIRLPVAGSNATWPEMNTKPFALIACEYGPIALGALGVETASRVKVLMSVFVTHSERSEESLCSWSLRVWAVIEILPFVRFRVGISEVALPAKPYSAALHNCGRG